MPKFKDSLKDVIWTVVVMLFLLVDIVISLASLFGGGAAENNTNLTVFFLSTAIGQAGMIFIFATKLTNFIVEWTHNQKKAGWIGNVLHDPENSFIPIKNKYFSWIKNPFLLALAILPVVSILGVIQVYQNTFLTSLPQRSTQQITEAAQAISSIFPADQEIWVSCALAGFLMYLFLWLKNTKKIDAATFYLMIYLVIPILYTASWTVYHLWRYSSNAPAVQYVILFGAICAYFLVIFWSVIPVLIFKITNNLYEYLNGAISSNETILIATVFVNFLLIVLLAYVLTRKKSKVSA